MGWWDVNEAIRSYQRLSVGFLYADCAAFQWEHNAVTSPQDSTALGEAMVVEWRLLPCCVGAAQQLGWLRGTGSLGELP